ncbi:MAG TPA: hypothetical protein VM925_09000 [Labilithrix sp.]|nr:hypothetical protein [Labilithrix sp.]
MDFLIRLSVFTAAAVALGGCLEYDGGDGCGGGANGIAGNLEFQYRCTSSNDPQCEGSLRSASMPAAVAQGAHFGLSAGAPVSAKAIETVGTGLDRNEFVARASGTFGFVVLAEPEAVDGIRITVTRPVSLAIEVSRMPAREGSLTWSVWQGPGPQRTSIGTVPIRAVASANGVRLAGTLNDFEWGVEPPDLGVVHAREDGGFELQIMRAGSGRIHVSRGGLVAEASFEVREDEVPDAGGDADTSEGGADAGDGGDLDAGDGLDAGGDQ